MIKPTLDELLAQSAPRSVTNSAHVHTAVDQMVKDSRPTPRRHSRAIRALWIVPAVGLGGLALTAGGAVINSTVNPDVTIPISYSTASGTQITCTLWIEGGSMFNPGSNVFAEYLGAQDWFGVGERIHDRAIALAPSVGSDVTAWFQAETELTVLTVPESLLSEGDHAVSDSDCTGRLD